MLKQHAYKFQLKPHPRIENEMSRFAGCTRLVWNRALALQKERLELKSEMLSYVETAALLVGWKEELPFLREAHSQPLQQTLKDLDRAFRDCFRKGKGFPGFKKKGRCDSFRYPQGFKLDGGNSRIYLPKIGWVGYRKSREIEGKIKNVIVSRKLGKWYVAIQVDQEVPDPVHSSLTAVGIDMGVAKFATLSDGKVYPAIQPFRKMEKRLKSVQQRLSKKIKFSANWQKDKRRIETIHSRIANIRRDYLHKVSTEISKNHAMVVVEELKVANMSKSARGTLENPGRNVQAKSGLNKSILDQGWYQFRQMLEYKQRWNGGILIKVDPRDTSKSCSKCGHCEKENRRQSLFQCVECGFALDADLNAAINILAAGHAVLACGGRVQLDHPMKQEPSSMAA